MGQGSAAEGWTSQPHSQQDHQLIMAGTVHWGICERPTGMDHRQREEDRSLFLCVGVNRRLKDSWDINSKQSFLGRMP